MQSKRAYKLSAALALATAVVALPGLSAAANGSASGDVSTAGSGQTPSGLNTAGSSAGKQATGEGKGGTADAGKADRDAMRDTSKQVQNAAAVAKHMQSDPKLKSLLSEAKAVFIVPKYGRGGLGIAGRGGEGVLMAHNGDKWSSPAFYNFGGISVGAQAGAEVGSMAMLLMNDKAVNAFMQDNKFSLNADAGLTIVNYTAEAQAQKGRGDVVVWTDTKGAFADAAVGVTDIHFDQKENQAWYQKSVAAREIISGKVSSGASNPLEKQLSGK